MKSISIFVFIFIFVSQSLADSTAYRQPNLKMLPITILAFAICIDQANDIGNINDAINQRKELGLDYHDLTVDLNWKKVTFTTAAITGIINLFISLRKVEIKPKNNRISLYYHFH